MIHDIQSLSAEKKEYLQYFLESIKHSSPPQPPPPPPPVTEVQQVRNSPPAAVHEVNATSGEEGNRSKAIVINAKEASPI